MLLWCLKNRTNVASPVAVIKIAVDGGFDQLEGVLFVEPPECHGIQLSKVSLCLRKIGCASGKG